MTKLGFRVKELIGGLIGGKEMVTKQIVVAGSDARTIRRSGRRRETTQVLRGSVRARRLNNALARKG